MYGVVVAYTAPDLADAVETLELVQHLERVSVAIEQSSDLTFGPQLVLIALYSPQTAGSGALAALQGMIERARMRSVLWTVGGGAPSPELRAAAGETIAATGNPALDREALVAAVRRVAKVRTHSEIVERETQSVSAKRRRVASRASVMMGVGGAIGALVLAGFAVWVFDTDPRFAPKSRYADQERAAALAPDTAEAAVPPPAELTPTPPTKVMASAKPAPKPAIKPKAAEAKVVPLSEPAPPLAAPESLPVVAPTPLPAPSAEAAASPPPAADPPADATPPA